MMHTGSRMAGGLLALTTLVWAGAAVAQDDDVEDRRFYVAPLANYGFFDEDTYEPDDDVGGQINIGKRLTDYLAMELFAQHFDGTEIERNAAGSDPEVNATSYGVSALVFPVPDLAPVYGIVGGGLGEHDFNRVQPSGLDSRESEFYDVGLGFLWPITDYGTAIRAEYRYRSSEVDAPGGGDFQFRGDIVSLGIQLPLGAKPQPEAEPAAPEPEPIEPNDSDGDGVIDRWDQCPDTPADTPVDSNGCAVEREEETPIVLKGVTFEFDSAKLTVQAEDRLDNVVNSLKASDQINVQVAGHTDHIGSDSYNQDLSARRAESVKAYLVNHGIAPERLTTKGYGESRPVAPNDDPDGSDNPEGRAQNRRVELNVTDE